MAVGGRGSYVAVRIGTPSFRGVAWSTCMHACTCRPLLSDWQATPDAQVTTPNETLQYTGSSRVLRTPSRPASTHTLRFGSPLRHHARRAARATDACKTRAGRVELWACELHCYREVACDHIFTRRPQWTAPTQRGPSGPSRCLPRRCSSCGSLPASSRRLRRCTRPWNTLTAFRAACDYHSMASSSKR